MTRKVQRGTCLRFASGIESDTAGELFLVGKRCQQAVLNHGKVAPAPVFAAENSLQVGQHALESEFASSIESEGEPHYQS
jgi:hypothetical protein